MNEIIDALPILAAALMSTVKLSAVTFLFAVIFGAIIAQIAAIGGTYVKWMVSRYVDLVTTET